MASDKFGPSYTALNRIALLLLSGGLGLIFVRSTRNYICNRCMKQINTGEEYAYRIIRQERIKKRTCVDCLNDGFCS